MDDRRDDRARRASRLDALARATDDLAPSDDLAEAVMSRLGQVASASLKEVSSETDAHLASLARATDTMDLADAFSDAVMVRVLSEGPFSEEPTDALVDRLARLTNDIAPTNALTDAVMSALPNAARSDAPRKEIARSDSDSTITKSRENRAWADIVMRSSRPVLFVTAAVAALCVLFSTYAERNLYPDVISSVDPVEVTE